MKTWLLLRMGIIVLYYFAFTFKIRDVYFILYSGNRFLLYLCVQSSSWDVEYIHLNIPLRMSTVELNIFLNFGIFDSHLN
jgi:hypothetical protein